MRPTNTYTGNSKLEGHSAGSANAQWPWSLEPWALLRDSTHTINFAGPGIRTYDLPNTLSPGKAAQAH